MPQGPTQRSTRREQGRSAAEVAEVGLEAIEALGKRLRKLTKALDAVAVLERRKAAGDLLEASQLDKIERKSGLKREFDTVVEARRVALQAASPAVRVQLGACANCGIEGHASSNCPRPGASSANGDKGSTRSTRVGNKLQRGRQSQKRPDRKMEMQGKAESSSDAVAAVARLDRAISKAEKEQVAIEALRNRVKQGQQLERNQLEKMGRSAGLTVELERLREQQREARQRLNAAERQARGLCRICASAGHATATCPRVKPVQAKLQPSSMTLVTGRTETPDRVSDTIATALQAGKLPGSTTEDRACVVHHSPSLGSVLVVAEKPSVAKTVATIMSGGKMRSRGGHGPLRSHDFFQYFAPAKGKCSITVTSVVGHIFALDFAEYTGSDPGNLFGSSVAKSAEGMSAELRVCEHLVTEAQGVDYLFLWLDCDREGENICYEVIEALRQGGSSIREENIFRARFSALTPLEIKAAFARPGKPREAEAAAVDVRQTLDLKIGCSFTRLLTREFASAARYTFEDANIRIISYGPCQTPTLQLCVNRAKEIAAFRPRLYWRLHTVVRLGGHLLQIGWMRSKRNRGDVRGVAAGLGDYSFNQHDAKTACSTVKALKDGVGRIKEVHCRQKKIQPPKGLNTVELLRQVAGALHVSPSRCMEIAERLYLSGFISYPRTESTRLPQSFDALSVCVEHRSHSEWGDAATNAEAHLKMQEGGQGRALARLGGKDKGDHPPITPVRCCTRAAIRSEVEWRVYRLVTLHFFAMLLPAVEFMEKVSLIDFGGVSFKHTAHEIVVTGWLTATPWRRSEMGLNVDENVPTQKGDNVDLIECSAIEAKTVPPNHLAEAELVGLMDRLGIGTDASIPQHIKTICDRQYVNIRDDKGTLISDEPGQSSKRAEGPSGTASTSARYLVPTRLGTAIIDAFNTVDPSLVQPDLRAYMETEITRIAETKATALDVQTNNLALFYRRYLDFADGLALVRPFFVTEAAAEHLVTLAAGESVRGTHACADLARMSDRAIAVQESLDDVTSSLAADLERSRLDADRRAQHARIMTQEQEILTNMFNWTTGSQSDHHSRHSQSRALTSTSGELQYRAQLRKLKEVATTPAIQDLESRFLCRTSNAGKRRDQFKEQGGRRHRRDTKSRGRGNDERSKNAD